MYRFYYVLVMLLALLGCRSAPFKVEQLSTKESAEIKPPDRDLIRDLDGTLSKGLAARYRKAHSPSFALINGYYKLPTTKPFGAATIVRGYSYNTAFEVIAPPNQRAQGYAIEPISADDALMLNKALNSLLDIGVKIKEISMSDALNVAKAESEAEKSGKHVSLGRVLPPNVDYLISVYPSHGSRGPVLIGRVIAKDGRLVAFRVVELHAKNMLSALIISLFEDTINRI